MMPAPVPIKPRDELKLLQRACDGLRAYVGSMPIEEGSELPNDVRAALACFVELRRKRNAVLRRTAP